MFGRLLVVNLVGDRFVNPGKFCCGIGNEFAGGPDKRADLFGGPRELGLAIAGWVIWATKAAAWFTEAADDTGKPFIACCNGTGWVGKMA